jgi:RNA polymerase sigma-70 factor (ECF subfamily)
MQGAHSQLNDTLASTHISRRESDAIDGFLDTRSEESFTVLFRIFSPQLMYFFRFRNCEASLAEDLTQEVMLTAHLKAGQIRDRALFRAWLFKIARTSLCRHYEKRSREVQTVNLADVAESFLSSVPRAAGTVAFEFLNWITFLDSSEREIMRLRFVEQWEYHEIAAAQSVPIGTVQWRVFNSKKKLAAHLALRNAAENIAA